MTDLQGLPDVVVACIQLVERAGGSEFELGHKRSGWYALAKFNRIRIIVDKQPLGSAAAMALAERLLRGAGCKCRRPVTLSDDRDGCRWRLIGRNWEPGCDAPLIAIKTQDRGNLAAMARAYAEALEADCEHAWHYQRTEPTDACPSCGEPPRV